MRTSLISIFALIAAAASGCTYQEPYPKGCAYDEFTSSHLVRDVSVRFEIGAESSDANVNLDVDFADGSTMSLFLDTSGDDFEAFETNEFDFRVDDPFLASEVTAMTIRVDEELFASGPLDVDHVTLFFDSTPMFDSPGPPTTIPGGSMFDTACPAPL